MTLKISPGISLEGMMLKLKLQYFGHFMRRVDSLEKTLMLGGIGCINRSFMYLSSHHTMERKDRQEKSSKSISSKSNHFDHCNFRLTFFIRIIIIIVS